MKADLNYNDGIEDIKIHGDFFIEPPEALQKITENLEGLNPGSLEDIVENVDEVDAELIGFSSNDLAEAVMEAVQK